MCVCTGSAAEEKTLRWYDNGYQMALRTWCRCVVRQVSQRSRVRSNLTGSVHAIDERHRRFVGWMGGIRSSLKRKAAACPSPHPASPFLPIVAAGQVSAEAEVALRTWGGSRGRCHRGRRGLHKVRGSFNIWTKPKRILALPRIFGLRYFRDLSRKYRARRNAGRGEAVFRLPDPSRGTVLVRERERSLCRRARAP